MRVNQNEQIVLVDPSICLQVQTEHRSRDHSPARRNRPFCANCGLVDKHTQRMFSIHFREENSFVLPKPTSQKCILSILINLLRKGLLCFIREYVHVQCNHAIFYHEFFLQVHCTCTFLQTAYIVNVHMQLLWN